ncbi:aspartate aminotransferase family protein [Minwuia sp.]|uniref:aspartate aminotransferase family protein n=1 Tax=Minwuia sp. TaxID=2493630 RepID=UPI003A8FA1DE
MTHVFRRQIGHEPPVASHGDGVFIVAKDGRRYLDASGGAAVSCLGHSDQSVIAAIRDQLDSIPFAHTGFFTTDAAEKLCTRLAEAAPGDLNRVYLLSGGSEATEAALKLARQYYLEKGEPDRAHFIARHQSYHGNTVGALSIGGNMARRAPYQPILKDWSHVSPCFAYRGQHVGESDEAYTDRLADELDREIERIGSGRVAGFLAEPVVGASLGAAPAVAGYFKKIRAVLDRHGVLMILDEVMCGMGRVGTLYACEQEGVVPDILTCAKGLGAGYQPIGAMIVSEALYQTIAEGSGAFQHGHTYMGHPAAAACALAVNRRLVDDGLVAGVHAKGAYLENRLTERLGNSPHIGDIRGRGLFLGIELVKDRETKSPFDPKSKLNARIREEALRRDMICYPGGGTVDGTAGDHVLLAPPYIISEVEMDEIAGRLGDAIEAAIEAVGGAAS